MDIKRYRIQAFINKAMICFSFVMLLYFFMFVIAYKDTNLINAIINSDLIIRILNGLFVGGIVCFAIVFFILDKEKFKLKPTIVFASLIVIYIIYYFIYGKVNSMPINETISNIKHIVAIIINMYFVLYVLTKVMKMRHIKVIYFGLLFVIFASFVYAIAIDFHTMIETISNKQIFDVSALLPFTNKNIIGAFIFISALISFFLFSIEKKKIYLVIYGILFIPNLLSLCKTSIACMFLLTLLMLFYFKNKSVWNKIIRICLIAFIIFVFSILVLILFNVIQIPALDDATRKILVITAGTITSRFVLFAKSASLLNYANVWLGSGYSTSLDYLYRLSANYFHNSYMYLLQTGGILLTLLFICVFCKLLRTIRKVKSYDHHFSYVLTISFVTYICYSIFENSALFSFDVLSILFTILIIITPEIVLKNYSIKYRQEKSYKKVAFITTIYPTRSKKWYGIYLKNLAKAMIKIGHKLTVIYIHEGIGDVHYSVYDGIPITHIYYKSYFMHKLIAPQGYKFKRDFEFIIKNNHFDDAIIHFYPPAFQNFIIDTLKDDGVKVLHYIHSRNIWKRIEEKRPLFRKFYLNHFYKKAYKKCDSIICVSNLVENDFKVKLKKAKTEVVYNGVESIFFNDVKNIKKLNTDTIKLVSVGNLYSIKGHKYVLMALKQLVEKHKDHKFEYLIIGKGHEKENLKQMVKEFKLTRVVKFISEMPPDQVQSKLSQYDIFVLPSYYEGLGCCYLEAMASGCYTIGCRHQGISEIINSCNGYLVDEYSSEEIVTTIDGIIKNSKHNTYIRRNAIKTAKNYTWLHSARELSKYL